LHTTLFTNFEDDFGEFDNIVQISDSPIDRWEAKYKAFLLTPYVETLHLDADTLIVDDISELFDLLNRFDVALPFSPWYISRKPREVPVSFPEFAGGLIIWRNDWEMRKLWGRMYNRMRRHLPGCDEPALREELYKSDIRFSVVPWEYTCVMYQPGYLFGKAKLIHGRSKELKGFAEKINSIPGRKVWTGERILHLDLSHKKTKGVIEEIPYT